ncbi:MAG: hypothetical protein Q4E13_10020 [Clostridia bacterium]|nr:hypothetical protein [Clostridia bacterium]
MRRLTVERSLYGQALRAEVTLLDEGVHVLFTGGVRSHVGAVSIYEGGHVLSHVQRLSHRDGEISRRWAEKLSKQWRCCVTVACGVHYDGVNMDEILEILAQSEDMLAQVLREEREKNEL